MSLWSAAWWGNVLGGNVGRSSWPTALTAAAALTVTYWGAGYVGLLFGLG